MLFLKTRSRQFFSIDRVKEKTWYEVEVKMQSLLNKIDTWLSTNCLSLNLKKQYIL